MSTCKFHLAWRGPCNKKTDPDSDFCSEHKGLVCSSCGGEATGECNETFGLVCGAPLCDECEHEVAPDGTNGANSIHVKKTDQRYKYWFEQTEEERLRGKYLMVKRSLASNAHLADLLPEDSKPYARSLVVRRGLELQTELEGLESAHPELVGLKE